MFDPEIVGVTSSQLLSIAQSLTAPTLGFMFLFLLSLPLKKLPIIDVSEYKPPSWVLPLFAIGSFFLFVFCLSAAGALTAFRAHPSQKDFLESFQIERRLSLPAGSISSAKVNILEYDGDSNFRIYVNGYRVFGSSSNCIMGYQCKQANDEAATKAFQAVEAMGVSDPSIYHIHRLYSLPHVEDISGYLIRGTNAIDVHSENSGVGDCALRLAIEFSSPVALKFSAPSLPKVTNIIAISPLTGGLAIPDTAMRSEETFFSGGTPIRGDEWSPDNDHIEIYRTKRSNGSYRLCQRIRISFELSADQTSLLEERWSSWATARRRELICEIRDDKTKDCSK